MDALLKEIHCEIIPPIILENKLAPLSKSSLSENYVLAVPLLEGRVAIIKIHDTYFDGNNNIRHYNINYIQIPNVSLETQTYPVKQSCFEHNCANHKNNMCEKSLDIINTGLNNRFYYDSCSSIIDICWSTNVKPMMLSMLSTRGDAFLYRFKGFNEEFIFNAKEYLLTQLDSFNPDFEENMCTNDYNVVIIQQKYLDCGRSSSHFFAFLFKLTYFSEYYTIFAVIHITHKPELLFYLDTRTTFTTAVIDMLFAEELNGKIYICFKCEQNEMNLVIFEKNWTYNCFKFYVKSQPISVDICPHGESLNVSCFCPHQIDIYKINTCKNSFEFIHLETVETCCSSAIVFGQAYSDHFIFFTRNGYIVSYDLDRKVYDFKCLSLIKNEIISNVIPNNEKNIFFLIRTIPSCGLKFTCKKNHIEVVFYADFNVTLNSFFGTDEKTTLSNIFTVRSLLSEKIECTMSYIDSFSFEHIHENLLDIFYHSGIALFASRIRNEIDLATREKCIDMIVYFGASLLKYTHNYLIRIGRPVCTLLKDVTNDPPLTEANRVNKNYLFYLNVILLHSYKIKLDTSESFYLEKNDQARHTISEKCYICESPVDIVNYQQALCSQGHILLFYPLSFNLYDPHKTLWCQSCNLPFETFFMLPLFLPYGPIDLCPFCKSQLTKI